MMNPFKKIARLCVGAYAKNLFNKAIEVAESKYKERPDMYYVINDPNNPKKLVVINNAQFRTIRHIMGIPSKELTMQTLKNTCWYHTKNLVGKDALSPRDITIRKLAFLRDLLHKAKLD